MAYEASDFCSPVGPVRVTAGPKGVLGVSFCVNPPATSGEIPARISNRHLAKCKNWLEKYTSGRLKKPFPWSSIHLVCGTPFEQRVWRMLWEIPFGEAKSYKWVAKKLGLKGGARAVGQANRKNPLPIIIPCHRVISADGSIGGYRGGVLIKKKLLQHEGVEWI